MVLCFVLLSTAGVASSKVLGDAFHCAFVVDDVVVARWLHTAEQRRAAPKGYRWLGLATPLSTLYA